MHIAKVEIENIRSIQKLNWSPPPDKLAGWHIILGNNGAGKSTFLKSIALALMGSEAAWGLRLEWDDWLRRGKEIGEIKCHVSGGPKATSAEREILQYRPFIQFKLERQKNSLDDDVSFGTASSQIKIELPSIFFAGYGPFRRFGGKDSRSSKNSSERKLQRCLSLFDESIALTECLEWLRNLKFSSLESADNIPFLERLKDFINHDNFLPSGVKLHDISSKGVAFKDGNEVEVQVENLSDGFRSILSMTLELIRQLSLEFKNENIFSSDGNAIIASGVVLIDEIDVHLHPTWQQQIGQWFCDHFPNIQFIVTTHSPLVCQSAEQGSIFVLPRIGSDESGHMLEGEELHRVLYGNVLDAYGTEAFGEKAATTRSESSQNLSRRLCKLNNQEKLQGLSAEEKQEQLRIKGMLPSKQGRDH